MECVPLQIQCGHLLLCDFDLRRIFIEIGLCPHLQAGPGGGAGNQFDHSLMAGQRLAAPVLADEGEEPVFDFIPFAGPRRIVAYRYVA